jgi:hypothetical protein
MLDRSSSKRLMILTLKDRLEVTISLSSEVSSLAAIWSGAAVPAADTPP